MLNRIDNSAEKLGLEESNKTARHNENIAALQRMDFAVYQSNKDIYSRVNNPQADDAAKLAVEQTQQVLMPQVLAPTYKKLSLPN